MTKCLFISSVFRNLYQFRRGLMTYLVEKKYDVGAIAAYDGSERLLEKQGVRCLPLYHIQRGGMNPIEEVRLLWELFRYYKSEGPDVILHYTMKPNIYGSIAAALSGTRSISTVSGVGYSFIRKGVLELLSRSLYKTAFRFPKRVFFQNADDRDLFEGANLVRREKIRLVPGSGVDLEHYSPGRCFNECHGTSGVVVFLFVGRLLRDKGIVEFDSAAELVRERFPRAEFRIIGRADHGNPSAVPKEMQQKWKQKKGIRYLGHAKDVRPFICESDVVVLPSYREGIPRALLEAMAMAKPIITTDAVGCRNVVENGKNGFMVPVRNSSSLAAAMLKMIDIGQEKRREMGRFGRLKAEREFDERIVVHKYVKEIEKILAEDRKY